MIDSRFFWVEEKSNPRGSLFRFPAMDPGAARDTENEAHFRLSVYIGAHALVTLFKYLFCPPDYISTIGFSRFNLDLWIGPSLFHECFSSSIFFHLTFSKFLPLPPRRRKSATVSRKTCSQRISLFLFGVQQSALKERRQSSDISNVASYDDQIREIKFLSMLGHLR